MIASADSTSVSSLDAFGLLQIDRDVASSAQEDVVMRRIRKWTTNRLGALDTNYLGSEIGQQHRSERSGADSCDLDDAITIQWSGHGSLLTCVSWLKKCAK